MLTPWIDYMRACPCAAASAAPLLHPLAPGAGPPAPHTHTQPPRRFAACKLNRAPPPPPRLHPPGLTTTPQSP